MLMLMLMLCCVVSLLASILLIDTVTTFCIVVTANTMNFVDFYPPRFRVLYSMQDLTRLLLLSLSLFLLLLLSFPFDRGGVEECSRDSPSSFA